MTLKGIKKGTLFLIWSEDKKKWIKSVVTEFYGDSINNNTFSFQIGINHLEPIQGNDSRYFSWGSYSYEDIKNMKRC